jgi:hypothetical protein
LVVARTQARTHYQVLGVGPDASAEQIRQAHRQLARVLHPDRQVEASAAERTLAERRMREVNAAWTVLSDPVRRTDYDRQLRAARTGPTTAGAASRGGSAGADPRSRRTSTAPWDADDPDAAFAAARAAEVDDDEPELSPGTFWLLRRGPVVALLLVAVGLFFVTAYAGSGAGDDGVAPTTTNASLDCVDVVEGRTAVRTPCRDGHDGRIMTTVRQALDCPSKTTYVIVEEEFLCVSKDPSVVSSTPSTLGD